MHLHRAKVALVAGAVSLASLAFAKPQNLPLPEPNSYPDTERSLNCGLTGRDDLSRFFDLLVQVAVATNVNVQVALGTDRNRNGDLAPEETGLVVGYDCGTWFIRDEVHGRERVTDATDDLSHTFTALLFPQHEGVAQANGMVFCSDWDRMKVTVRGPVDPCANLVAKFRKNPTLIILR